MTSQELTQKQELLHDHWYATFIPDPIELDQFLRSFWDDPSDKEEEEDEDKEKATEDDYYDPSLWDEK
jgi:hypothetical protein